MADIVITTDFSQVNQLNDTLKSTGNLFTRVVDSLMREENRAKRVTKALAKTTEENLAIIERAEAIVADKVQKAAEKREKARQREAERAEKESKRVAAAAEKAAKAEAKLAQEVANNQAKAAQQSTAGLNQRLGVTGSSAMNSGAGFGALEQEIERLRQKYDRIYASSQLYETSLEELNRAHMLGITSIKQHEAAVESLNAEYQAFQSGVAQAGNRFAQHVNQTSDGLNKFGVAAQQTGYQVSDFIVQVQSGTNPLVAFSQQATQLAGLLYLLPPSMQAATVGFAGFSITMATATAGLTILIPLLAMLAMNFVGSGKESEEASKKIDRQAQAYENLKTKVEELRLERQMSVSGAESQDEQNTLNEILSLKEEQLALQKQLNSLEGASGRAAGYVLARQAERDAIQAKIDEREITIETLTAQATETERINRLNQIRTNQILGELAANQRLKQEHAEQVKLMGDQLAAQGRMKTAAEAVLEKYGKMRTVAAGIANELSRAADETVRMANAALATMKIEFSPAGQAMAAYGSRGTVSDRPVTLSDGTEIVPQKDRVSSGVSGGGSKTNSIDSLINQLQTERETLDEWYVESQEMLKSASDAELEILGGKYEAMSRLEAEYRQRSFEAQQAQAQMSFQAYSGMFSALGDLLSVFGSQSKGAAIAALAIQKGLAIAQIVVSTAAAQMRAFAELGPIAGAGMAAKIGILGKMQAGLVAATGLAQAASIGKGSVGGVGSGVGSATVAPTASAPAPQTVFIDSINPESLYSGETLINLFEAFYDENDKRGKVFMVAR